MNGRVVSTPLLIKLLCLASPSLYLDSNLKGGCVQSGRSGPHKPINAATPGWGTSVCYLPMKDHKREGGGAISRFDYNPLC